MAYSLKLKVARLTRGGRRSLKRNSKATTGTSAWIIQGAPTNPALATLAPNSVTPNKIAETPLLQFKPTPQTPQIIPRPQSHFPLTPLVRIKSTRPINMIRGDRIAAVRTAYWNELYCSG